MTKRFAALAVALCCAAPAAARGVSPYLPLQLSPEIERAIERGLALADVPVMKRPIAAATVLDALPDICLADAPLCAEIERYLTGLSKRLGLAHASLALAAGSDHASPLPNQHGMRSDSAYRASASVYFQAHDLLLVSAGFLAYEDETVPTGTLLSFGTDRLQVDVGYREHWLSPLTGSSMLIGTEPRTLPSVTLSNYAPLTRLRLRYEAFIGELGHSQDIRFEGTVTSGHPKVAALHLSIEPVPGWSLGINRLMQYGGGARSDGLGDLLQAFFGPNRYDNSTTGDDFGNQVASFTSRFLLPGRHGVSVYFEYAGEDTSKNSDVRLGNAALSAGISWAALTRSLDLTLELSEWQNGWYVNHLYGDGLTHEGNVLGHWGADWRATGDGVGASSAMVSVGWRMPNGQRLEGTYRTLANESYTAPDYERAASLELRLSRAWGEFYVGGELYLGRDVFGDDYSRVSGFIRF